MIDVMIMRDHVIDIRHHDNVHPCQIIVVEMILVEVPKSEWFVFIPDHHKTGGGLVNIQGQGVDHLIYIERKEVQMVKEKNIKTITKNSVERQSNRTHPTDCPNKLAPVFCPGDEVF